CLRISSIITQTGIEVSNSSGSIVGNDTALLELSSGGNFLIYTTNSSGALIQNDTFGSYSADQWYKLELEFKPSTSEVTGRAYDSS
ncbi:hypothetical protein, partial [Escherichia coli]|uniref:hypothetical protein n=1 Tax=Escherichia coli TaxID=562 RepID=UPI001BE40850